EQLADSDRGSSIPVPRKPPADRGRSRVLQYKPARIRAVSGFLDLEPASVRHLKRGYRPQRAWAGPLSGTGLIMDWVLYVLFAFGGRINRITWFIFFVA